MFNFTKVLIVWFFANFGFISCDPTLNPSVVAMYKTIKLSHKPKYMLFGMNPKNKEEIIITKNGSDTATYDDFLKDLDQVKKVKECTYAVYDFNYVNPSSSQEGSKMVYYLWAPDSASLSKKVIYTASNDYVKRSLVGVGAVFQASTSDEIQYAKVLAKCIKSK